MSEHQEIETQGAEKKPFGNKFILPFILLTGLFIVFYFINHASEGHDHHGDAHHAESHNRDHHDHETHMDGEHHHDNEHHDEHHEEVGNEMVKEDGLNFEENSWAWSIQNYLANGTGESSYTLDKISYEGEELSAEGAAQLDQLAKLLNAYPDMKVVVKGHSRLGDNAIEKNANKVSSKGRALWVQGKLASRSVSGKQMKAKGMGGTELLDGVDPKDMSQRRVTIQFEQ